MIVNRDYFELRRRIDGLVYQFDRAQRPDDSIGYKRRDKDLWLTWHDQFGWIAWDEESQEIRGRSWETLPEDQVNFPPQGVWVSVKYEKSYVYDLVYPNSVSETLD